MKRIYTPARKKTILIVDDDQIVVRACQENFQRHGYKVKVADNEHNVMQTLRNEPIDLMIFDLCLPGMEGVEVLKNIRSEGGTQALPIIVISNAYLGNLGRAALEAGATKCLTKTESAPGQMLDLVRELIGAGHSNAAGAISEVVVSNPGGIFGPQFDADVREEMVAMLLINAPETLARLRTGHQVLARMEQGSLRKTELSKMHRQSRWLAGSAGPLGFRKIADMANALEALLIQLNARPAKITPSVIRTIAQAIDTLASLFERAVDPEGEGLVPPRILVVDDEIISRETVCSALSQAGLRPISLDDPLAARRLLEQEQFDLIFLDVEMPEESGLDLCVDIREMPTNHVTPVVFVTSHSDFASRAQSTLSGGNDFIAKPFLLVELAVKALTWLFRKSPEPISTEAARDSAPPKTACHESLTAAAHVAPSDLREATLCANVGRSGGTISISPEMPGSVEHCAKL